jgi:hypothetical protein
VTTTGSIRSATSRRCRWSRDARLVRTATEPSPSTRWRQRFPSDEAATVRRTSANRRQRAKRSVAVGARRKCVDGGLPEDRSAELWMDEPEGSPEVPWSGERGVSRRRRHVLAGSGPGLGGRISPTSASSRGAAAGPPCRSSTVAPRARSSSLATVRKAERRAVCIPPATSRDASHTPALGQPTRSRYASAATSTSCSRSSSLLVIVPSSLKTASW